MKLLGLGIALLFPTLMLSSQPATAETCSEILRDGTLSRSNIKKSTLLQRMIYIEIQNKSLDQFKKEGALGYDYKSASEIINFDGSESSWEQVIRESRYINDSSLLATNSVDAVLSMGDETIVRAWTACMLQKTSAVLSVRFDELQPQRAVLRIELARAGIGDDWQYKIVSTPPIASPADGILKVENDCLKKDTKIGNGWQCRVTYFLGSGNVDLNATVTIQSIKHPTTQVSESAYLPKRLKKAKNVQFTTAAIFTGNTSGRASVAACARLPYGWEIKSSRTVTRYGGDAGSCSVFNYGAAECFGADAVPNPGTTGSCSVMLTGEARATTWIAEELEPGHIAPENIILYMIDENNKALNSEEISKILDEFRKSAR